MKVSVAMCTYNGSAHVEQQLESLARQTRKPDELVVVDDRSNDATVDIVKAFARSAPFPVALHVNLLNLGSTGNFAKASGLCGGDLIFWSDQDDYWHETKIERSIEVFNRSPTTGATICNANVVDPELRPKGFSLWETLGFDEVKQHFFNNGGAFDVILHRNVATGMTMAIRAEHLDLILPIPTHWHHDGWAAILISTVAPMHAIGDRLVEYRQHGGQLIGAAKESLRQKCSRYHQQWRVRRVEGHDRYMAVVRQLEPVLERLESRYPGQYGTNKAKLMHKIAHFRARADMRNLWWGRYALVLNELRSGAYSTYSSGYKSVVEDLFF